MKFTLNDCLSRINQVLNYPAVAYEDVSHFFDQAIYELNTSLRIALPSVTEMREENAFNVLKSSTLVHLTARPTSTSYIPHYHTVAELNSSPEPTQAMYAYVCDNAFTEREFYRWTGSKWVFTDAPYAVYVESNNTLKTYAATALTTSLAVYAEVEQSHVVEFDLTEYLPISWWTLFIIPYVCFKFSVRNGDSGELFTDEFTQGYQQLQASYNVPNTVNLVEVAGKPAYKTLVSQNLSNLNITVFTRAIYDSMRIGTGTSSAFGGFYIDGGWI